MGNCPECKAVNHDGNERCGVCGAVLLYPPFGVKPVVSVQREFKPKPNYLKPLAIIASTLAVLFVGSVFTFVSEVPALNAIGLYILLIGIIMSMALLGIFAGAPRRGRAGYRADRYLKRKQEERQSD